MSANVLSQAAFRVDFEWEFGDPVSISYLLEDQDVSGAYECVIRDAEQYGNILAVPTITATWTPNEGTDFLVQLLNSTNVPVGRWWYSMNQVNGVTRFKGRVEVLDGNIKTLAYASILDAQVVASSEVEDVATP